MKTMPHALLGAILAAGAAWASPDAVLSFLGGPAAREPAAIAYGGRSSVSAVAAKGAGTVLSFRADDRDYSGFMIDLPEEADLSGVRDRSFLELRIRGARGGERLFANLVDGQGDEPNSGVQSRQPVLAGAAGAWTEVRIPLWQFPASGVRYFASTRRLGSGRLDWKRIHAFFLGTEKGGNPASADPEGMIRVEVAGIRVVEDPARSNKPDIDVAGLGARPAGDPAATFAQDAPPSGSWDYCYGGTTRALWIDDARSGRGAALYRGDDREYSGWTLHLESPVDLSGCLAKGVLEFKLRGRRGGERIVAGLLDDPADGSGHRSQVRIDLSRRVVPTTRWQEVSIPLREFGDMGLWWDDKRKVEVPGRVDWSRIQEFRISSDRGANTAQRDSSGLFEVQIADVRVDRDAPQPWDAQAHWKAFRSSAPPESAGDTTRAPVPVPGRFPAQGWAAPDSIPLEVSDWSRHAAIRVRTRTSLDHRIVQIHVVDGSGETWSTSFPVPVGRSSTTVPFSRFLRNPSLQGPQARADGRFDLEHVRSVWAMPGWVDGEARTRVEGIVLTNDLSGIDSAPIPPVRVNTVGFRPGAAKRFLSAAGDRSFALLDSSGKAVMTGEIAPSGWWEAARESLWVGDFSRWTRPGTYRIAVGTATSAPFRVAEDAYDSLVRAAVGAFRYQRAEPLGAWAGRWSRGAHPDTLLRTLEIPGAPRTWSAPGGWYDAGDYGKYVVNAGISAWSLLTLDQLWTDSVARNESLFEAGWLERMQVGDGGVVFKVGSRSWSRFVEPQADGLERFAIGRSTTSALDFAAVLARASRTLAKSDPARSAKLLSKARKAFAWAAGRPFVAAPDDCGGTGSYEDPGADDEFAWAASEIWLASGSRADRAEAVRRLHATESVVAPDWQHVQDLALVSIALSGSDDSLAVAARAEVERLSDSVHEAMERSPARVPTEAFPWGSNSFVLGHAVVLVASHRIGGAPERLSDAQEILDYVLGRNALGRSFVTGFGDRPPLHPHMRPLGDGRPAIPGYLVGGPNPGRQDELSRQPDGVVYPWPEPARSWTDRLDAYAGNEVAINWNAALALVAGYLARQGR